VFLVGVMVLLSATVLSFPAAETADAATAVEVSAGDNDTCALLAGDSVDCWGNDEFGQLGDGTTTSSATPVPVSGLGNVIQVSAGGFHTCALLAGGTVECWGDNKFGQLGDGTTTGSLTPVAVSGLAGVTTISAGLIHTCALLAGGSVDCWGDNGFGQLGDGTMTSSSTPVAVSGLANAVRISGGSSHACALLATGTVECWGENGFGQLGDGTKTKSSTPVPVSGLGDAGAISVGGNYSCAIQGEAGEVECWGQLNPEGETAILTPTPVALGGGATEIAVGGSHACALLAGTVECWGDDDAGQLGNGEETEGVLPPVSVSGLGDAAQLSAGGRHTCAVVAAGGIECWGANESGQLGNGTTAASPTPLPVIFTAKAPAAGGVGSTPSGAPEQQQPTAVPATPTPVFGKTVSLSLVSGTVLVKLPGHRGFVPLAAVSSVPVGTVIDTSRGKVQLFASTGPHADTQSGLFYDGVFRVTQKLSRSPFQPGRVGLTVLTLTGGAPSCGGDRSAARASSRHRGANHLWGEDDHGDFQTGGRYASATVGGTKWLTAETCAGTRVKVARGVVSVADKARHRTVLVTAPHSYLARPAGR
jgi:alpha-tubulin suppressor-like RCC1 family protein